MFNYVFTTADPPLANMPVVDVTLEDGATAEYMIAEREMMSMTQTVASTN
jgi:hypothetical protein